MSLETATLIGTIFFVICLVVSYSITSYYLKCDIIYSTGIFVFVYFILELIKIIKIYTSTKILSPKETNEWVIITGCTSGLGKAMTFDLAKQGFNLLLIARNQQSLDCLKNEINQTYPYILVESIQHDFSNIDQHTMKDKLCAWLSDKYIGVLVNNVGISNDITEFYGDYDLKNDYELIDVNIKAQLMMTKILLPKFAKQSYGYVLNISSGSAYNSCPYIATYGASKAGLRYWSNALANEYKLQGIKFYVCLPLFFLSNMVKENESFLVPKAEVISSAILRHCLVTNESCPYFPHWFQNFITTYTPIPDFINKVFTGIYKKRKNEKMKNDEKKSC